MLRSLIPTEPYRVPYFACSVRQQPSLADARVHVAYFGSLLRYSVFFMVQHVLRRLRNAGGFCTNDDAPFRSRSGFDPPLRAPSHAPHVSLRLWHCAGIGR